jgi:hypothetical protein
VCDAPPEIIGKEFGMMYGLIILQGQGDTEDKVVTAEDMAWIEAPD